MPAFIKTKADDSKWQAIKHSVAKQRGKKIEDFGDSEWKIVNAAWHKSEGNEEEFKKSLMSVPSATAGTSVPSAMKMPKMKSLPKATDKPSKFFKSEDFGKIKRPSIENLRVFLERHRGKK